MPTISLTRLCRAVTCQTLLWCVSAPWAQSASLWPRCPERWFRVLAARVAHRVPLLVGLVTAAGVPTRLAPPPLPHAVRPQRSIAIDCP